MDLQPHSQAYWYFLDKNNIRNKLSNTLEKLDRQNFSNLNQIGEECRRLILNAQIADDLKAVIIDSYSNLKKKYNDQIQVAVRSSATAEDLPGASFAGQQESYLNIKNENELLQACIKCYASLFTDRAIKYREDNKFSHMKVALSIGIQRMVRSDKACSGVIFTLDTETGFEKVVFITGSWGLGENIVQGNVNPDEFYVFKPSLKMGKYPIISKTLGSKAKTMVYLEDVPQDQRQELTQRELGMETTINLNTPEDKRDKFILQDNEIETLAKWAMTIEEHYRRPMDIEWAKDGTSDELFIVQARPETIYGTKKEELIHTYSLKNQGKVLITGLSVGNKIASGKVRILNSPAESDKLNTGEVLVTDMTNPDWDPVMKKASAIITNKGGRTSHAAIVAREVGAVAVVGCGSATTTLKDGEEVTVSCIEGEEGKIYEGKA